jgi:outer membrane protein, heavy metal efflux system
MKRILILLCTVACSLANHVWAEEVLFEFNDLVREALSKSPEAAKIDATLAERMAEAFSTGVKENPELSSSFDIPSSNQGGEKTEISINLSQAIRPSDFGDRTALATVIEQTASLEKQMALNQYVQNLNVLYTRVWQYQEIGGLLKDTQKRASQFLGKVSEGAKRGIFSEGDVELFRAEVKTFEADSVAAHGELSQTAAELTRLSGVTIRDKKLQKINNNLLFSKEEFEQLAKESNLPIQKRVLLLKSLAQKQLEVARLDSFPAISPLIGYSRHDDGIDQVTVGFSVPLPLFNSNQSEKIKAQGALVAAEQEQRYATSDAIVQEVQLIYEAFQSLKKQVELYDTGIIPAKRKVVEAYYRQFDAGVGTAFQLWQALRELNTAQLRSIELKTSLTSAHAQINALIGKQL